MVQLIEFYHGCFFWCLKAQQHFWVVWGCPGQKDALGDGVYAIRGGAATPASRKWREWPRPTQKDGPIVQSPKPSIYMHIHMRRRGSRSPSKEDLADIMVFC